MPSINEKEMVNKSVLVQNFLEQARVPLTVPWSPIRDWSLIIQRRGGGYKTGGGRACEVLPLREGGMEKVLAMPCTTSIGVVFTQ